MLFVSLTSGGAICRFGHVGEGRELVRGCGFRCRDRQVNVGTVPKSIATGV